MDAAVAGPCEIEPLKVLAKIDDASFTPGPCVVVEEYFFYLGEKFKRALYFGNDVFIAANAPGMPGESLRPEAVDTAGRTPS